MYDVLMLRQDKTDSVHVYACLFVMRATDIRFVCMVTRLLVIHCGSKKNALQLQHIIFATRRLYYYYFIIINEQINVAFTPKTSRTRNKQRQRKR